jgi:hypothetical protein
LRVNYVTSDERWKCFTKGKGVLVHAIVKKGGAKRSKGFACPIRHKQKTDAADECFFESNGGAKRDRTADLLHAMQALSQLSYSPVAQSGV